MQSALKLQAEIAFRKGQAAKSIALYSRFFESGEQDYFDYLYIAAAYMQVGLPEKGLVYYDHAIDYSPSHGTAFTRKSCYLLEQKLGAIKRRRGSSDKKQISMATLGNKCRFGNQIFQYAYLICYARKFDLDVGTPTWVGSYVFGLNDPMPNTQAQTIREFRLDKSMLEVLHGDENILQDRNITGFFQHHTGDWKQYRDFYQQTFIPSSAFQELLKDSVKRLLDQCTTLIVFHIRRGDYILLDEFPTAPTNWYLEWLHENWHTLSDPLLYIATDDPATVDDFAVYSPHSYSSLGVDFKGIEFAIDWLMLRQGHVVGISDSSFSMSAAMANINAETFLRPNFDAGNMQEFDPWNSPILSSATA